MYHGKSRQLGARAAGWEGDECEVMRVLPDEGDEGQQSAEVRGKASAFFSGDISPILNV